MTQPEFVNLEYRGIEVFRGLESAIEILKREFSKDLKGVIRRHEYALSPSERRREKDRQAAKRRRKALVQRIKRQRYGRTPETTPTVSAGEGGKGKRLGT